VRRIWVDADACPGPIKEILFRAAERTKTPLTLVANHPLPQRSSSLITNVQVASGFDVADNEIVRRLSPGDLVITADIPLAAEVIDNDGDAINPRGERYTKDTIKARLTMRNFMDELRGSGIQTGGPSALSKSDRKRFADQLDRWLAQKRQNL
jgi:uncharacterized protein YaiI (UPF0178 family)